MDQEERPQKHQTWTNGDKLEAVNSVDHKKIKISQKTGSPKHNLVKGTEIKGRINNVKNVTRNW